MSGVLFTTTVKPDSNTKSKSIEPVCAPAEAAKIPIIGEKIVGPS